MEPDAKYRHEFKYEITYGEYMFLSSRLKTIMKQDKNASAKGEYRICSLYFDNCYDKALREKLDGVPIRDKYRIRYYNDDFSYIKLEKKSKHNGLCLKKSCFLKKEECEQILNGDIEWMASQTERPLLQEFHSLHTTQLLRPKTIVSYTRIPYVYEVGNVRVTFDRDIRSGLRHTNLFDLEHPLMDVLPGGKMILEIKYDEFMPDIIRMMLQSGIPRVKAFSKYAACRQYE